MSRQLVLLASLLLLDVGSVLGQPGAATSLVHSQLVRSRKTNALVFNDYQGSGFNFKIELDAAAEVHATGKSGGEYLVNGWSLGIKAAPAPVATGDTAALRHFVASEATRLLGSMPGASAYIRPVVRQFTDKATGRRCILWGFEMPEALDKSLDGVYYLYFQDGSHLLSLGITQPKGQPMRSTLDVLFIAQRGYSSSAKPYPAK